MKFNNWLVSTDKGRLKLYDWVFESHNWPSDGEIGGYHHMGGTRMHSSEKYGVVDKNCKIFGSENIYVAGSSIFTTGGQNNPTLPVVQFSLRLADYLMEQV